MNNTTTKILSSLTLALLSALPMTGHAAPGNSPGFVQVTGSYSTIGNLITPFVGSISCSYRASVPDSSTLGT